MLILLENYHKDCLYNIQPDDNLYIVCDVCSFKTQGRDTYRAYINPDQHITFIGGINYGASGATSRLPCVDVQLNRDDIPESSSLIKASDKTQENSLQEIKKNIRDSLENIRILFNKRSLEAPRWESKKLIRTITFLDLLEGELE